MQFAPTFGPTRRPSRSYGHASPRLNDNSGQDTWIASYPPMGASHSRAYIRIYDVMQGRKMNVMLDRNERLPTLLRLINTEWSGDFRLRCLGADCPTPLYLYWLGSEVTHQSYVLAFEAMPPGAMSNTIDPPTLPFPARQNGVPPPHTDTAPS